MEHQRPRTLPIRVSLRPGEALDSWLYRLAHRNGMPLLRLAAVLGFAEFHVWRHFTFTWRLASDLMRRIEFQTGQASGALAHAVPDQFDLLGWKPIARSRYCPHCIQESDGIWPIRWQLPYTFACVTHGCLLAATCPSCDRIPRSGISKQTGLLPPSLCSLHVRGGGGCHADLRKAPSGILHPDDPRLEAQTWVNDRLDHMDSEAVTALRNLDNIVLWLRTRAQPAGSRSSSSMCAATHAAVRPSWPTPPAAALPPAADLVNFRPALSDMAAGTATRVPDLTGCRARRVPVGRRRQMTGHAAWACEAQW